MEVKAEERMGQQGVVFYTAVVVLSFCLMIHAALLRLRILYLRFYPKIVSSKQRSSDDTDL